MQDLAPTGERLASVRRYTQSVEDCAIAERLKPFILI